MNSNKCIKCNKCNKCNKPNDIHISQLNTHQEFLKKTCRCKHVIKQNEELNYDFENTKKYEKICRCKHVIKQNEELNYDFKNIIKEFIIYKYFK